MSQGIYIALSGAKLQQRRLELLSNNLANANTTGYKTDNISAASFEVTLDEYMTDDGNFNNLTYTQTGQASTDFSKGSMKNTGSPLNLALDGPGFFVVETPFGERYTRDGNFRLNKDGELVTHEGYKVKGRGLSDLGNGNIHINSDGDVYLDDGDVYLDNINKKGSIEIVAFTDQNSLKKEGHNLFSKINDGTVVEKPEITTVKQGFLEMSNVNVVSEMVNMIEVNRLYEAYQKMIRTIDESSGKAINELVK
jgi:flagellar basal-body rod protein FlgG